MPGRYPAALRRALRQRLSVRRLACRVVNVVFVEPASRRPSGSSSAPWPRSAPTVIGIGESRRSAFDDELRSWMTHYHQVPNVIDVGVMTDAVRWIQDKLWVDRLEATIEAHTMAAAQVRENCTIPGTSVRTAWLCRDKPSMKEALRAAGVPTAASTAADNADQVRAFADAVGYPLILKPRSGAGALDTTRVDNSAAARGGAGQFGGQGVTSIAVEEFVEGHEGFYDTLSIDGRAALDFVSHYFPNVLEAMRTRWISPQFISTNRVDSVADYEQLREMGQRVNEALGIGTSATHMEWFFGPKGLRFSEIGCRPPGVGAWDLYSAGNDLDIYREWANAIVHGQVAARRRGGSPPASWRCAPSGTATITGYSGVDEVQARSGEWVIDAHLPPAGTRPSRSRPATWPTPTSGCGTPTTTRCAACSTTSAAPSTSTPVSVTRDRHAARAAAAADPGPGRRRLWASSGPSPPSPPAGRSGSPTTPSSAACSAGARSTSRCTPAGSTCSSATASSPMPSASTGCARRAPAALPGPARPRPAGDVRRRAQHGRAAHALAR